MAKAELELCEKLFSLNLFECNLQPAEPFRHLKGSLLSPVGRNGEFARTSDLWFQRWIWTDGSAEGVD